jgi:hypothetical protein
VELFPFSSGLSTDNLILFAVYSIVEAYPLTSSTLELIISAVCINSE